MGEEEGERETEQERERVRWLKGSWETTESVWQERRSEKGWKGSEGEDEV